MSKQKTPVRKMTPVKPILDEESDELHEERRAKLDNLIIMIDDHLKVNENNAIDHGTMGSINDSYQAAVKWSNVLNWLSQIKANRYIIPETAAKIQEQQKAKLKPEDAARLGIVDETGSPVEKTE